MTAMTRKPMTFFGSFTLLSAIVSFFGFHIVSGDRGLMARPGLELKIVQAEEKLTLLNKHQRFLQQRIALLHGGSVDADILDFYPLMIDLPAYRPVRSSSSSMRNSWLYFASRSDRDNDPVLICPAFVATARSAIK